MNDPSLNIAKSAGETADGAEKDLSDRGIDKPNQQQYFDALMRVSE
jgi:hypothetical protein